MQRTNIYNAATGKTKRIIEAIHKACEEKDCQLGTAGKRYKCPRCFVCREGKKILGFNILGGDFIDG